MTTNWRAVSHVISKILWTPPPTPAHTSPLWHIPEQTIFKKTKTDHKYQSSSAKQNNTVSKWTNICACWSLHNGTKIFSKSHFKHKVQTCIARLQKWKNLPLFFQITYKCHNKVGIFFSNFCGLFTISELFDQWFSEVFSNYLFK